MDMSVRRYMDGDPEFSRLYQSLVPDDESILVDFRLSRTTYEDATYLDTYIVVTPIRLVVANVMCHSFTTQTLWVDDLVEIRRTSELANHRYFGRRVNHERLELEFRCGKKVQLFVDRETSEFDNRLSMLRELYYALSSARRTHGIGHRPGQTS